MAVCIEKVVLNFEIQIFLSHKFIQTTFLCSPTKCRSRTSSCAHSSLRNKQLQSHALTYLNIFYLPPLLLPAPYPLHLTQHPRLLQSTAANSEQVIGCVYYVTTSISPLEMNVKYLLSSPPPSLIHIFFQATAVSFKPRKLILFKT